MTLDDYKVHQKQKLFRERMVQDAGTLPKKCFFYEMGFFGELGLKSPV